MLPLLKVQENGVELPLNAYVSPTHIGTSSEKSKANKQQDYVYLFTINRIII